MYACIYIYILYVCACMCVWMQFIQALHKVPAIQQPRLVKSLKIPFLYLVIYPTVCTCIYIYIYICICKYIYIYMIYICIYHIYIYTISLTYSHFEKISGVWIVWIRIYIYTLKKIEWSYQPVGFMSTISLWPQWRISQTHGGNCERPPQPVSS